MKLAIVIASNDPETVFNALRLGNFARKEGDEVGAFLVGKGVELEQIKDERFDVSGQAQALLAAGARSWPVGPASSCAGPPGQRYVRFPR